MTDVIQNELRRSNLIDDYIKNGKKNLRRKIERNISCVIFTDVRPKLYIYSDSIEKTGIITMYLENRLELDNFKSKSSSEKGIVNNALMIREKIKTLR